WVLLGGAATVLGPLVGTLFMYYVVDITSNYTTAYLLFVGVTLILLVLYVPKGVLGTVLERWLPWLP
ncbi:MAG: branched-chain amino acid ABC transporter permease, partial [Rhizobiaceae bacterium]